MQTGRRTTMPLIHGLLALGLAACGGPTSTPESEVRAWLETAEAAAEARDRGALLDLVSNAYVDGRGNDKADVGNMLRVYFLRQHTVSLLTRVEGIHLQGTSAARVELFVGMAGSANTALGLRADAYNFELELVRDDDEWQLIGARWGEVGGELR